MEQFPQLRNAVVQIVVFDDGVRPNRLHEGVLAHEFAGILHQHTQSIEQLSAETDFVAFAEQPSLVHIEKIVAEAKFRHAQTAAGARGIGKPQAPHMGDYFNSTRADRAGAVQALRMETDGLVVGLDATVANSKIVKPDLPPRTGIGQLAVCSSLVSDYRAATPRKPSIFQKPI
jgi:hypothetical protein